MNWLFTLIDRDTFETEIEEPVGFDACTIIISRDIEKHGIVFDYQGNDFSFYGEAMQLLKAEYETWGIEGKMVLVIAQSCEGGPVELYRGNFLFGQYKYNCGDECFVKIPIETTGDIIAFTNRFDQKVNLQTNQAFDEATPLVPYSALPFALQLPSKGILLRNHSLNDTNVSSEFLGAVTLSLPDRYGETGMFELANSKIVASEIGGYGMQTGMNYVTTKAGPDYNIPPFAAGDDVYEIPLQPGVTSHMYIWPRGTTSLINWTPSTPNYNGQQITIDFHYRFKGVVTELNGSSCHMFYFFMVRLNGTKPPDYIQLDYTSYDISPTGTPFDVSYDNPAFLLNPGDEIYGLFSFKHFKTEAQVTAGTNAFKLTFDTDSFFSMTTLSHTEPTAAKVFMVNEALSRVTEAITDDKIRVYSDYFGRTDSEPYQHLVDGCGALEAITKGLFIRQQENRIPGGVQMAISMKDLWEGLLEPLHHLGMGFEDDVLRPGYKRLRVEHWKFFYSEDILMDCGQVNEVERQVTSNEHYSTFKTGYEKWEAEEFNGLDEFLTKREYRLTFTQVKNELTKLSKFIASGYAWEVTRRKNNDSKDWRYDNDSFLVCLKRLSRAGYAETFTGQFLVSSFQANEAPVDLLPGDVVNITGSTLNDGIKTIDFIADFGTTWGIYFTTAVINEVVTGSITITLENSGFVVELGNVLLPENIIDPDTLYNYRLSPARIAMRWMDKLFASYRFYSTSLKLIFVDGEGNYMARGEMESPDCKWEAGLIGENDFLYAGIVVDQSNVTPLLRPERVDFEFPMSIQDFKNMLVNPYGKITWLNDCESGEGWIDKVTYKPDLGTAKFILIPKYE